MIQCFMEAVCNATVRDDISCKYGARYYRRWDQPGMEPTIKYLADTWSVLKFFR